MIRRYRTGSPIETTAPVMDIPAEEGFLPGWKEDRPQKRIFTVMDDDTVVYGLGETVRGMNKRGWKYISCNTDDPHHTEEKSSLYASQNFVLLFSKTSAYGLFADTPGRIMFDIGYTRLEEFSIRFDNLDVDLYRIDPDCDYAADPSGALKDVIRQLRHLTGSSYIPPKWAFGFGQSRWGYKTEEDVRTVADTYRKLRFPIDSIYMDIDYMEDYKDFTVDEKKFPDFPGFVRQMKDEHIHLVPIIDAGVKIQEGYPVCEEGVKNGYFCTKEDGTPFVAAVWPGRVHFPDYLNDEAGRWFGDHYSFLLDQGIEGFWNDMNEPAIFYTEDHLKKVFEQIDGYKGRNLDIDSFFEFTDAVASVSNNPEDYASFWHNYHGRRVRHDKVHNLYGFFMTKSAGEAFRRLRPDRRILMFSRSSYIGMHRYGGVWTGDNTSIWSHLSLAVRQMASLNMTGFLYSGSDTGGFMSDTTEDLLMRWTEFSIFTPLFRNHAHIDTRLQEYYRFERIDDFRNIVRLRYALIPYIYSEFMKAALTDGMYIQPLAFEYPEDERAVETEDELLVGESILIAPVCTQNAKGRMVYLPEDMKLVRFRSFDDYDEEVLEKGDHYVKAALNETLVFIRPGKSLPLADPAESVDRIDYGTVRYLGYRDEGHPYEMYDDDGETTLRSGCEGP